MLETIYLWIIAAAPALTAILGIVAAVVKISVSAKNSNKKLVEKFEEVREQVLDTKEYESVKEQLVIAHQENRELRKLIYELLLKIDKIEREK